MQQQQIEKTISFIQQQHKDDTSGHDVDHVMRVFQNVICLLEEEPEADPFITKMAALLHDVDDPKVNKGALKTPSYLKEIAVEDDVAEKIIQTIAQTSFSKKGANPSFETKDAALLSDADKLDAIGSIGIIRVIQYSQSTGRKVFDANIFPKENLSLEEYKDQARKENTAINHFFDKLLKLQNAMQTQAGKKEAETRHNTMVMFLKNYFREQNLNNWLTYLEDYLTKLK